MKSKPNMMLFSAFILTGMVLSGSCHADAKVDKQIDNMFNSGVKLQMAGDNEGALKTYKEIIAKYPDSNKIPKVMISVAHAYDDMGDLDKAVDALKELVKKYEGTAYEKDAQHANWMIDAFGPVELEKEGKFDEAIKAYKNLSKKYSNDDFIVTWAGDAVKAIEYFQEGSKDKALKIYKSYLEHEGGMIYDGWEKRGIERCSSGSKL